jgi:hypothetical protein
VVLEQAVLAAEAALAKATVANYALCGILALLEGAPDLLGSHCDVMATIDLDSLMKPACSEMRLPRLSSRSARLRGLVRWPDDGAGQRGSQPGAKQFAWLQGMQGDVV